jgi:peptidyl-tRNA hydrolase
MSTKPAKKKVNGNDNVLTEQMEAARQDLIQREMRARFAKANYEIMHYSLEGEKLQPAYKEYVEREQAKIAEQKKQYQEFLDKIKKEDGEEGLTDEVSSELSESEIESNSNLVVD